MKRRILIFGCIFLLNSTVYAQGNSTSITDAIPEQTNNFKGDKKERKFRFTIESGSIIENTSLDYRLFTTGNIDEYKQTISDGLLEQNKIGRASCRERV